MEVEVGTEVMGTKRGFRCYIGITWGCIRVM